MSFGLNQTVEAKQLVVEDYITAGTYAGDAYDKDLVFRAGDVEHSQDIKFSVFFDGELKEVAKITPDGMESTKINSTQIYAKDNATHLGKLNICHDSRTGENGCCGQMTLDLNCGLSCGDSFVEALRVTSDSVIANGSIISSMVDTTSLLSKNIKHINEEY